MLCSALADFRKLRKTLKVTSVKRGRNGRRQNGLDGKRSYIYDQLFSLQQALKLEGSDKPLEILWDWCSAVEKPPYELDDPLVEQLVELEIDGAGAIVVRPRGLDAVIALKSFAAMENPSTDLVARFAREHFVKLALIMGSLPVRKRHIYAGAALCVRATDRAGRYFPDHAEPDDRTVPSAGQISSSQIPGSSMRARGQRTFLQPILSACVRPSSKPPKCQALLLPLLRSLRTILYTCPDIRELAFLAAVLPAVVGPLLPRMIPARRSKRTVVISFPKGV